MEKTRVYGEKVSIQTEFVRDFYDKRASSVAEKGWTAVTLGDEDLSKTEKRNYYDQNILFPKLGIDQNSRVLDLGCGMGRWAKIVLPHCGAYCGVDFSSEMVKAAKRVCSEYTEKTTFFNISVPEAVEKDSVLYGGGGGTTALFSPAYVFTSMMMH